MQDIGMQVVCAEKGWLLQVTHSGCRLNHDTSSPRIVIFFMPDPYTAALWLSQIAVWKNHRPDHTLTVSLHQIKGRLHIRKRKCVRGEWA